MEENKQTLTLDSILAALGDPAMENWGKTQILELLNAAKKTNRHGLTWAGASLNRELGKERSIEKIENGFPYLTRLPELDVTGNQPNTERPHILIEGDNLHALTVLRGSHNAAVDLIYIDPPYNTGKEFTYNDAFIDPEHDYRHSSWLDFMWRRLRIARELLKDTGVILISIDDNEYANLKLLCDEVFGEKNALDRGTAVWINKGSTKGFRNLVKNHEYILAYAKNANEAINHFGANATESLGEVSDRVYIKRTPRNPVRDVTFLAGTPIVGEQNKTFGDRVGGEDTYLEVVKGALAFTDGILTQDVVLRGSFSIPGQIEEFFSNLGTDIPTLDNKGQEITSIWFNSNGLPQYTKNRNTRVLSSVIENVGNTGTNELKKILGSSKFSNPKPRPLIETLLTYFAPQDAVVLDFFAGSGTTGHAVASLNAEDGGTRQAILVTLDENNICREVTRKRMESVLTGSWADGKKHIALPGSLVFYEAKDVQEFEGDIDGPDRASTVSDAAAVCVHESVFLQHGAWVTVETGNPTLAAATNAGGDLVAVWKHSHRDGSIREAVANLDAKGTKYIYITEAVEKGTGGTEYWAEKGWTLVRYSENLAAAIDAARIEAIDTHH